MDTELDDIEGRIIEILKQIALDGDHEAWPSDRDWTTKLNQRISALGRERDHYICGSGCKAPNGQGEWLYDLVWLSLEEGMITDVPLVLESEWSINRGCIGEDFQKLLLARANRRVMIFQQRTLPDVEEVYRYLSRQISAFRRFQHGDRYLLAGLHWTPTNAFSHLLVVVP